MVSTDWPARLRASPALFPLSLDVAADKVRFVSLGPIDYEKASFLDARVQAPLAAELAYSDAAAAMAGAPIACDWIFHVGHVGSTLISRLLGTHPRVFSLREPQILRAFAQADVADAPWPAGDFEARLSVFLALFSRTWGPPKRALIKATSMVSGLAGRLLALSPGGRALFLTVTPETYLATMLSGANLGDVRNSAPVRLARLERRLGRTAWRLDALSPGELVALSWACDMADFAEAAARFPERIIWVDFDAFLAGPQAGLATALAHLHGAADAGEVARMAGSAYLQRYSKAPEYAYGPELRGQVLAEARAVSGGEIAKGLAWLQDAGRAWPAIAQAVERGLNLA